MTKLIKTLTLGSLAAALATSVSLAEPKEDGAKDPAAAADSEKPKKKKPDLAARFVKLDKDSDGFVSAEELKAGFKKKPEMAEKMMKRKDKNSDGKLSKEEFVAKPTPRKKKKEAETTASE
jgi:hypothetical protein